MIAAKRARVADQQCNPDNRNTRRRCEPATDKTERLNAGISYRNRLVYMWSLGKRSSHDICNDAWLHTRSGGGGCEELGLDINLRGSNQSNFLRTALGLDMVRQLLYEVFLPVWWPASGEREIRKMWVRLPHERIAAVYKSKGEELRKQVDRHDFLVPSFTSHPVTREYGAGAVEPVGYVLHRQS